MCEDSTGKTLGAEQRTRRREETIKMKQMKKKKNPLAPVQHHRTLEVRVKSDEDWLVARKREGEEIREREKILYNNPMIDGNNYTKFG